MLEPEIIKKIPPTTDKFILAALSYVWFVSVIMLVIRRDDDFIKFHAKQGLVLLIAHVVFVIPVLGWIVGFFVWLGMIAGFAQAWQGKKYEIPVVYGLSQKFHL